MNRESEAQKFKMGAQQALFRLMRHNGVDLSNPQSIAIFLEKLKSISLESYKAVEKTFDSHGPNQLNEEISRIASAEEFLENDPILKNLKLNQEKKDASFVVQKSSEKKCPQCGTDPPQKGEDLLGTYKNGCKKCEKCGHCIDWKEYKKNIRLITCRKCREAVVEPLRFEQVFYFLFVLGLVVFMLSTFWTDPEVKPDPDPELEQWRKKNFGLFQCDTPACSGHSAGYRWAEEHQIDNWDDCTGNSQSFIEGCQQKAYETSHGWGN